MWYAIKLNSSTDCRKICSSIQTHIFDKFVRQNIPLEGKILYFCIKEPQEPPVKTPLLEYKKLNISES
jgi:hypothetical protein